MPIAGVVSDATMGLAQIVGVHGGTRRAARRPRLLHGRPRPHRAEQRARRAQARGAVLAYGGEGCLGPLTEQCLELAAEDVRGGVLERCGHRVGDERPDLVAAELLAFFGEQDEATPRAGAAGQATGVLHG